MVDNRENNTEKEKKEKKFPLQIKHRLYWHSYLN